MEEVKKQVFSQFAGFVRVNFTVCFTLVRLYANVISFCILDKTELLIKYGSYFAFASCSRTL